MQVIVTWRGECYHHTSKCSGVKRSADHRMIDIDQAQRLGYKPCFTKKCRDAFDEATR